MDKIISVIVGGSGGIGKYVVKKFLDNKNIVIVLDINDIKDEQIIKNENFYYIKIDVTDVSQIEKAKEIILDKYGYIDNIVSMAGINMKTEIGGIEAITIEDIDKSIKLNLNSHIYVVKILLQLLKNSKKQRKTVTMVSSINAITDYGLPAYSAAKAGIYGFMNSIARSLGVFGIRVNTISLGTVPHDNDVIEENKYFEEKIQTLATGEFLKPEYVADSIYSLVNEMHGIIGQNIIIDMGQSI